MRSKRREADEDLDFVEPDKLTGTEIRVKYTINIVESKIVLSNFRSLNLL